MFYQLQIDAVAFDKTGTLTQGCTEITDFLYCVDQGDCLMPLYYSKDPVSVSGRKSRDKSEKQEKEQQEQQEQQEQEEALLHQNLEARYLLQLMLLAESRSSHPLAKGITSYCKKHLPALDALILHSTGTSSSSTTTTSSSGRSAERAARYAREHPLPSEESLLFDVVPGLGICMHTPDTGTGTVTDTDYVHAASASASVSVLVGSAKLLEASNVDVPFAAQQTADSYRAGGKVAIFVSLNGSLRAVVGMYFGVAVVLC
jgi:cation transport ATPase